MVALSLSAFALLTTGLSLGVTAPAVWLLLAGALLGVSATMLVMRTAQKRVSHRVIEALASAGQLTPHLAIPTGDDDLERLRKQLTQALDVAVQRDAVIEQLGRHTEEARAMRGQLLATMNHELRTPLNAILGFGQVLDMSALTPDQRDCLRQVLRGGRHLLRLINDLLELSKLDAGRLELSPEPVAARELLAEALDLVQPMASERSLTIEATDGAPIWVRADRERLRQVLINLLSNAVKFSRPGGYVRVQLAVGDTRVRFSITDTGPGLNAGEIDRLFVPFDRLNASELGVEGIGLGLALSQRLVERMAGTIGVESARGEGATFWVELPEATAPDASAPPGGMITWAKNEDAVASGVVLQIDDNEANTRLVERLLASQPLRVLSVMQGRLGLELARQHRPRLILLDLNLPDMHGLDVLQRLGASRATADIPVVVITADATLRHRRRAEALGARALLAKPLEVPKFLAVVHELLHPAPDVP
jgi:signal transduction histidine kinase/CheY-like chemotaxis protein